MTYTEWCKLNNCTHAHCPRDCEYPQPIIGDDGKAYCAACWFRDKELSVCVPCNVENCDVN